MSVWSGVKSFFKAVGDWFLSDEDPTISRGESSTMRMRDTYAKQFTKKNSIKGLFDPKTFLKGYKLFDEKSNKGFLNLLSKEEYKNINELFNDDEANIYAKAKMINLMCQDILDTTEPIDVKEAYKKYVEEYYEGMEPSTLDTNDERFLLPDMTPKERLDITESYRKGAQQILEKTNELMETLMASPGKATNKEALEQIESQLNSQYNSLIVLGYKEAEAYMFPIQQDEVVAHNRYVSQDIKYKDSLMKYITEGSTEAEINNYQNRDDEESIYTFSQRTLSDLYKKDIDKYKAQENYNADAEIDLILDKLSGDLYEGVDEKGNYKFSSDDDSDFKGIRGFNDWKDKGYLDGLLQDKQSLEELAVMYNIILQKQGEDAAVNWLQERIQHYASEGQSWDDYIGQAVGGFVDDIVGDAAEIVGGVYGVVTGVGQGIYGTFASDDSIGQVWTDAVGQAFDNNITRWGSNLSKTGRWTWGEQQKAINAFDGQGIGEYEGIIDPEHADRFLLKGGGTGIGYFLSETGRQASHTMFSVWAGSALGGSFAKGGAMVGKMLYGTQKAMRVGYRIGSTIGLAIAGSNEGIMDGLQVKDDVMRQGLGELDAEFQRRAIYEVLKQNGVDVNDELQVAQFLQKNHIGDYETQDEKGNTVLANDLIKQKQTPDKDGEQLETTMTSSDMISMFQNSDKGKDIIDEYLKREDIAKEYEETKRALESRAIWSGAATAVGENVINGTLRSYNSTARANLKAQERQLRKLRQQVRITGSGKVTVAKANVGFALRSKLYDAKNEAIEEASQNITQTVFTNVGNNSIKRRIDMNYDGNTWAGFMNEIAGVTSDVVTFSGQGIMSQETYEAAVQGAVGSMMGFLSFKKGSGTKWYNHYRPVWKGSIFNYRSELKAENEARRDLQQALQNAIDKEGGVRTIMAMHSTKQSLDIYNSAIENRPNDNHANNELAVDALLHNVSTLLYTRDTEFGKDMMAHLAYQSQMLGEDYENSELSQDEINKRRLDRAKEFLTTQVEGEELTNKKNAALVEVQEYVRATGGQVRTIEEIAENPTDVEAQALVDIVMTAQQTNNLIDQMDNVDKQNSLLVRGLDFVAKNELNVKTLLIQNQQERLDQANKRITRIAEQRSPDSNGMLTVAQKGSIARLGNNDDAREKSRQQHAKDIDDAKKQIDELKEKRKEYKKQISRAKVEKNSQVEDFYSRLLVATEQGIQQQKAFISVVKDNLNKDKKSLLDVMKGNKDAEQISEDQRVLTAYDILTLSPYERAMMLDPKNKDKYSDAQQEEIKNARHLLVYGNAVDLIGQTNVLDSQIKVNTQEVEDVLTNVDAYNKHVENAQKKFRTSVLNYRYEQEINKDKNVQEVREFIKRLEEDVEQGLISEEEKNDIIERAQQSEAFRKNSAADPSTVKNGWQTYRQIKEQPRTIGSTIKKSGAVIDETRYDNLMEFLDEQNMTIQQFNDLDVQQKATLLSDSKILDIKDNETEIDNYIDFAANTMHLYNQVVQEGDKRNQNIPLGSNNNSEPEDRVVKDDFSEEEEAIEEEELERTPVKNKDILQKRLSVDGTRIFGSKISSIINYLTDTNILQDPEYKDRAQSLLNIVRDVAMSDTKITSVNQLYDLVDMEIDDPDIRNTWGEVKNVIRQREVTTRAAKSNTHRDRSLAEQRSASSSTIETQRISQMRMDEKKHPLIAFLEEYSYEEAAKHASRQSQGSTGLGQQIFYVTDPTTTQRYQASLGSEYTESNNLPVFACVRVSNDYNGKYIPITIGSTEFRVVPIGVLNENTPGNANARGILWSQAIRDVAAKQVNTSNQPIAVSVNNMPITSAPQNYKNWIRHQNAYDYTGRRTIMDEVKGFGDNIKTAVNGIISKLRVKDVNDRTRIVYDNGSKDSELVFIRQAGLSELRDASQDALITDILMSSLDREIDNPIIRMFYNNINSLAETIGTRQKLMTMTPAQLNELNNGKEVNGVSRGGINNLLSRSFWIAGYNGIDKWKYEIQIDQADGGTFVLKAVPDTKNKDVKDKNSITLLDFSKSFDEEGNIALTNRDANIILQNLIFDGNGEPMIREGFGTSFAQVQLGRSVVKHATGEFAQGEKNWNGEEYTEDDKQSIKENAHSVLSALIEGGGLLVEGQIDNPTDHLLVQRPGVFDKDKNVVVSNLNSTAQNTVLTVLNGMGGTVYLDTTEAGDSEQSINRSRYIEINQFKNKPGQDNRSQTRMWVTRLAGLLSGMSWAKRQKDIDRQNAALSDEERAARKETEEKKSEVRFNRGSNADLICRHILWTSDFNTNVQEKEGLKKIPTDVSDVGDEFYTDKELEEQFGFHAAHVKHFAYAFTSYLTQRQNIDRWTFVTNVIKPKQTIEITDRDTGNKYKVPIAGELDLLAIDPEGVLHPIDFKTVGFQQVSNHEALRSPNVDERANAIKEKMGQSTFAEYTRQLNIYSQSLSNMDMTVGQAYILAIPLSYPMDLSVEGKVLPNSEYSNQVLVKKDSEGKESQFLEGLGLFMPSGSGDNITSPVMLTQIEVPFDKSNFEFSAQDIIYMAQNDINFLRNNPELASVIDDLRASNANVAKIEIKPVQPVSPQPGLQSQVVEGRAVFRHGAKKKKPSSNESPSEGASQSSPSNVENLAIGKTSGNYNKLTASIENLEREPEYNEEFDLVEFQIGETTQSFTVKQVKELLSKLDKRAERTGTTAREIYNNMTTKEICDELGCMS